MVMLALYSTYFDLHSGTIRSSRALALGDQLAGKADTSDDTHLANFIVDYAQRDMSGAQATTTKNLIRRQWVRGRRRGQSAGRWQGGKAAFIGLAGGELAHHFA